MIMGDGTYSMLSSRSDYHDFAFEIYTVMKIFCNIKWNEESRFQRGETLRKHKRSGREDYK